MIHRRGGFTMIELVTSISVGVIISGVAAGLIWEASKQRAEIAARAELSEMGGTAVELMLRYIREIPQGQSGGQLDGTAQITQATASSLVFTADDGRSIGFRHDAASRRLEMTVDNGANWRPIATDANSFSVGYSKGDGSGPSSPADIRLIQVDLQLARGTEGARVRTAVYLRRFMNEG